MNGACLRSLTTVTPRNPPSKTIYRYESAWLKGGGRCSPLHRHKSRGGRRRFLGAMHGSCRRGLPVLRAGCIHPSGSGIGISSSSTPLLLLLLLLLLFFLLVGPGSGSLRRDDCRISLYIRFSSFMILHKLIQLDNQREKLTHVS